MLASGKLREFRRSREMTLDGLAQATGFSRSYLSQIERQIVNPSLSALQKIADALDVQVSALFDADPRPDRKPERPYAIVNPDRRLKLIYPGSQVENQLLTPALVPAFEFFWTTVHSGEGSRDEPYCHPGQECGVVIQGTIEFHLADEVFVLGPGQSIYFDATLPHFWRNIGQDDVHAVWVISPTAATRAG